MKYCTHCGAELLEEAVICPKCGCSVRDSVTTTTQPKAKMNVCALVGFILSMVSLLFFVNIMGMLGFSGMVTSLVGLTQLAKTEQRGKGLAIAGFAVGICCFVFGALIWTSLQ